MSIRQLKLRTNKKLASCCMLLTSFLAQGAGAIGNTDFTSPTVNTQINQPLVHDGWRFSFIQDGSINNQGVLRLNTRGASNISDNASDSFLIAMGRLSNVDGLEIAPDVSEAFNLESLEIALGLVGERAVDGSSQLRIRGYFSGVEVAQRLITLNSAPPSSGGNPAQIFSFSGAEWSVVEGIRIENASGTDDFDIEIDNLTVSAASAATARLSATLSNATQSEGNSGNRAYTVSITRSLVTSGISQVSYSVEASGAAAASSSDFSGGALPSGIVSFADGETSKDIIINVAGDLIPEQDETFSVRLHNAVNADLFGSTSFVATISNDDFPTIVSVSIPDRAYVSGDRIPVAITVAGDQGEGLSLLNGQLAGLAMSNLQRLSSTNYTAEVYVPSVGTSYLSAQDLPVSLQLQSANGPASSVFTTPIVQASDSITIAVDNDNDGVESEVEAAAPNNGDGNADGLPDNQQENVTSLPASGSSDYLTMEVQNCAAVRNVRALAVPAGDPLPYDFVRGMLEFELTCEQANITILYHGLDTLSGAEYRKYGPVPPGSSDLAWYNLPNVQFDSVSIDGRQVARVRFTLRDNELGDDTGDDGLIVDIGGPAFFRSAASTASGIPTLPTGLMVLLGLALAGIARRRMH